MARARSKGNRAAPGGATILTTILAALSTMLIFQPAAAEFDPGPVLDAFTEPGKPLYERLAEGFNVIGATDCEQAARTLQSELSATTRKEELDKVTMCLTAVRSRTVEAGLRQVMVDARLEATTTELEIEMASNRARLAMELFAMPGFTLYQRLETGFRAYGYADCSTTARDLQVELKVSRRRTKLREVTECLELFRSTAVQPLARDRDWLNAATAVDRALGPSELQLATETEISAADQKFAGQSWGVGFGVSYGFDDVIEDAVIVDGVVRVTDDRTVQPRVILEFHNYFFAMKFEDNDRRVNAIRGCGLFGGVVSGEGDVLAGVGAGVMCGWKSKDETKGSGFSVGAGLILDGDVKSLGKGFEENKPPPGTETTVRFETKARGSWVVFFTRTF